MKLSDNTLFSKFFALLRYIFIVSYYRKKLRIKKLSYIGSRFRLFISNKGSVSINGKVKIHDDVEIRANGGMIVMGNGCSINPFSRIVALERVELGDRVVIARFVSILDHDHNPEIVNNKLDVDNFKVTPIVIGNNVWLGDKVTITKGVNIGDNVIIAANSVVTKDIPSNTICGGVPAKILKKL